MPVEIPWLICCKIEPALPAGRAETQVAHRRIGHQLLPILLHQRRQRAVHNADNRKDRDDQDDCGVLGGVGQQRNGEAQKPVGPHLQQDAGQDDGAGGGRLGVRVGQPGVERKHRHLDGEAHEKGPENPPLRARGEIGAHQVGDIETGGPELREVLRIQV
jgi:hypothetical protein